MPAFGGNGEILPVLYSILFSHCLLFNFVLLFSQLLQLVSLLHTWRNIPIPSDFDHGGNTDDQAKKDSIIDAAFQTFCSSCDVDLSLPLEDCTYGQLEKLISTVWDKPIKTLFLSRYALEVTGIMRQTVGNALTSVSQVNLVSIARSLDARIVSCASPAH